MQEQTRTSSNFSLWLNSAKYLLHIISRVHRVMYGIMLKVPVLTFFYTVLWERNKKSHSVILSFLLLLHLPRGYFCLITWSTTIIMFYFHLISINCIVHACMFENLSTIYGMQCNVDFFKLLPQGLKPEFSIVLQKLVGRYSKCWSEMLEWSTFVLSSILIHH